MKAKLTRAILAVLQACDGVPIPETSLFTAVRLHAGEERPSQSDILEALGELETQRYATAVTDSLLRERTWSLTNKGTHKARQLG